MRGPETELNAKDKFLDHILQWKSIYMDNVDIHGLATSHLFHLGNISVDLI